MLLRSHIYPASSCMLRSLLLHNDHRSVRVDDIVVGCLVDNVIVGDVDMLGCLLVHYVDKQLLL